MVCYDYGKIYAIYNPDNKNIYIGSTSQANYKKRFNRHNERYQLGEQVGSKGKIYDNMNYCYIVLEEYPCSCREALLKREQYWMDEASKMSDFILTNFNRCWGRDYEFDDNIPKSTLQKVLDDKLISLKIK